MNRVPEAGSRKPERWVYGRGDLGASIVLIFPLLLVYEVAVAFAGRVNGADLVTRLLYVTLGSRALYLAFHAAFAVAFVVWIRRSRRWQTLRFDLAAPVLLEAAIYALTLGAVMRLVVDRVLALDVDRDTVVAALGAGVHEELVFRLGLVSGLVAVLRGRLPIAIALSAVLFALAHYFPSGGIGESFTLRTFVCRCVAGIAFALIFWYRSLAHAVYAHALYDLVVALSG
jgi:hypothetical protein